MLSADVLEELLHKSILCEQIVKTAWTRTRGSVSVSKGAIASEKDGFAEPNEPDAHLTRLLKLRHPSTSSRFLSDIIDAILNAVETSSIPDKELACCVFEFLQSPWLHERMPADEMSSDGFRRFDNITQVTRLWEATRNSGPIFATYVGLYAPIRVERTNVLNELFDALPEAVAINVINRDELESLEFLHRIEANPDGYPPKLVEEARSKRRYLSEYGALVSADAIRERRLRNTLNPTSALIGEVVELRRELATVRGELAAVREMMGHS